MPACTTPELWLLWWAATRVLLVQHHHGHLRIGPLHGPGRGQPHDAGTDHHHIRRRGRATPGAAASLADPGPVGVVGSQGCAMASSWPWTPVRRHARIMGHPAVSECAGADPQADGHRRLHRVRPRRRPGRRDHPGRAQDPGGRGHRAGPHPDLSLRQLRAAAERGLGRDKRQARRPGLGGGRVRRGGRAAGQRRSLPDRGRTRRGRRSAGAAARPRSATRGVLGAGRRPHRRGGEPRPRRWRPGAWRAGPWLWRDSTRLARPSPPAWVSRAPESWPCPPPRAPPSEPGSTRTPWPGCGRRTARSWWPN